MNILEGESTGRDDKDFNPPEVCSAHPDFGLI